MATSWACSVALDGQTLAFSLDRCQEEAANGSVVFYCWPRVMKCSSSGWILFVKVDKLSWRFCKIIATFWVYLFQKKFRWQYGQF